MINFEKFLVQNCEYGRQNSAPIAFVIHSAEGSYAGTKAWCNDPKSSVSYHFLVDFDGKICQMVDTNNTAWHAGLVKNSTWKLLKTNQNPNYYTIGIAYAGYAKNGPTFAQFCAIAGLVKMLGVIHKINIDKNSVIPHNLIRTDKVCPGAHVNFDALIFLARLT